MLSEHRSQGGLGQLTGGHAKIFHLDDGVLGIDDAVVNHGVDFDRDVVVGNDVLCRYIQHHCAQVDPHDALYDRDDDDKAWPFHLPETTEQEDHPALELPQHLDRGDDGGGNDAGGEIEGGQHVRSPPWSVVRARRSALGPPYQ